jgi:uncharacterized protein (DUF58 family)
MNAVEGKIVILGLAMLLLPATVVVLWPRQRLAERSLPPGDGLASACELATVNGEPVTANEFRLFLQRHRASIS